MSSKTTVSTPGRCTWIGKIRQNQSRGPGKNPVAPYHYLCNGQLTNCVSQPGTDRHLDAQGDKLMQRLVYRNIAGVESLVAVHSVNTAAGGGGVRWYEFRVGKKDRNVTLHQQGTYAPDALYAGWQAPGMDRKVTSASVIPSRQAELCRPAFRRRLATGPAWCSSIPRNHRGGRRSLAGGHPPLGRHASTAMDPADDCTFWYVGDYLKKGATTYSTKIASSASPLQVT